MNWIILYAWDLGDAGDSVLAYCVKRLDKFCRLSAQLDVDRGTFGVNMKRNQIQPSRMQQQSRVL